MNTEPLDDAEYPYSARYEAASPFAPSATIQNFDAAWKWLRRWLIRGALVAGVFALMGVGFAGFVGFRAARQAWLVAQLRQLGGQVTYSHEYPFNEDALPNELRGLVGDHVWSDVRGIELNDPWGWWSVGSRIQFACHTCGSFPNLSSFRVDHNEFTLKDVASWPSLTRLEDLTIQTQKLDEADYAVLSRMVGLKTLRLTTKTPVDLDVKYLANLSRLETLFLDSVRLVGTSKANPLGLPSLANLTILEVPELDDKAITQMGPMPKLQTVNIGESALTDAAVAHFAQSSELQSVVFDSKHVTDAGLEALAKCRQIVEIHLLGSQVTDDGVKALTGSELRDLCLDKSAITDQSFATFATLPNLEWLSVCDTKVTGEALEQFPKEHPLSSLDFSGAALTELGIQQIVARNPTMVHLARTRLTDAQLMLFVTNDTLTYLDIEKTRVTAEGFEAFCKAKKRRVSRFGSLEPPSIQSDFDSIYEQYFGLEFDPFTGQIGRAHV